MTDITWHRPCKAAGMTKAPLSRLLLLAAAIVAFGGWVKRPAASGISAEPTLSVSLHTPHLSLSVSL